MSDHFIWNLLSEPFTSLINFILNDHECKILFIAHDIPNAILSPPKFVYFNENVQCCNGRRHDVTCSAKSIM